jgi:hypothetical protein
MARRYLIESPHTEEECLRALDELADAGGKRLEQFSWGCMAGVHTGWGIVEAESESAAREIVPAFVRGKAQVVAVDQFTPEQIRAYHEAHK